MDLPATQAIDEEELPATQQLEANDDKEDTVVGTLIINNKSYPVVSGVTQIGRHPACKIVINHETVSKKHAEIEAESVNRPIFIRDLKSCNKTKINFSNLKPDFNYQIRDGDKLTFGQIVATFKLFNTLEESIVSCTPQVNRKVRPIIPGTPDSSMNASSASESDVSIIPGTQTDENDMHFRRPQVPVRTSTSNEHRSPKLPAFVLDDLPSPLKDKSKQEDISQAETQRFSINEVKENQDNSIYTTQTQKTFAVNKSSDTDENIYEMETQRPFNTDEDKDNIENLPTQRCDDNERSDINRKSLDVSIYSAETQRDASEAPIDEVIENLETQRFDCRKSDSIKNKSMDVSIYSAETQKMMRESSINENIENLETQRFDCRRSNSDKNKSMDVSIYSAETQKLKPETSQNKSIENVETQQFDTEKSDGFKTPITPKRYSKSLPIAPIDESLEDLETQRFDCKKSDISNGGFNDEELNESLANLETQQFDTIKSTEHETANSSKTYNKSLHDAVTQKIADEEMVNDSIDDLETQKFVSNQNSTIINESIEDLETQQFGPNKSITLQTPSEKGKIINESLHKSNTPKRVADSSVNESIDDLETQEFVRKSTNAIINESTEDTECQRIDKSADMVSSLSFSLEDMETEPFVEEKLPLCKEMQDMISGDPEELSIDSGFPTSEKESIHNKTNSEKNENENASDLQLELDSSSISTDKCNAMDDVVKMTNLEHQKNNSDTNNSKSSLPLQKLNSSEDILHNDELSENANEDNDDEMFCSQVLIDDCPFAFLPEESHVDDKSNHSSRKSEELEKDKKDDIFDTSTNVKNTNINVDQESLPEKSASIKANDDSETDEEGVFSSHTSKENESNESRTKNIETNKIGKSDGKESDHDSETDEEGVFSSHTSKENESNKSRTTNIEINIKTKKSEEKKSKSDSETDEEGVFSSHQFKEDESNESRAKNIETNKIGKSDGKESGHDSETDEEGVFSSHTSKENESNKSRTTNIEINIKTKKSEEKKSKSDSETDEEGVFSSHHFKEDESNESRAKNIGMNKIETSDKKKSNYDAETDEEGVFSSHLSGENEINNLSAKNSVANSKKLSNIDKISDSETDEEGIFTSNLSRKTPDKMSNEKSNHNVTETSKESLLPNRNSLDRQKSPASDVDDIFDEHYEEKINSARNEKLESTNEALNKIKSDDEVDELAPTEIIQPGLSETENMNLQLTESENVNNPELLDTSKSTVLEVDDLAPTQIINEEDNFLAPTQIVSVKKLQTSDRILEDDSLAPTQVMSREESPAEKSVEGLDDLDLAPTQKMIVTQYSESQVPTQIIDERIDHIDNENDKASVEGLDYEMAATQVITNKETGDSATSSKRQLEEIEIISNKKLKALDNSDSLKVDLNSTVEKNLDVLFEGPENVIMGNDESVLLTQQLEDILESSQVEESSKTDLNKSAASPTLSRRRSNFKGKNRRRAMMLNKSASQDVSSRPSINLNDTIERNLNEIFDNSINTIRSYESDSMLTQQLENVLESQDDRQFENEEGKSMRKSLSLTLHSERKKHRLSLSGNLNASSISKSISEKQLSKSVSVQSVDKNESTSQESNSNEESQGTEDYFANLKSKKKRNVFDDSQSDDEAPKDLQPSDDTKKVIYRRGTMGFTDDGKSVSTPERVALVEIKGRSFTSDSQSDGEDIFGSTLAKSGGKKRISLSLSKHVNLNASMSSLSDHEPVEKKAATVQQQRQEPSSRKSQASTSEKAGNDDPKLRRKSSVPVVSVKRVQAPGTLGFTDNLDPVEGEELVSAASTGSEDERREKQEKVGKINLASNVVNDKHATTRPETDESDDADSDEDLLKNLPAIKVAGTAECPPTDSQLAAPSDDERDSSPDIVIPAKWQFYASKRFDRIYDELDANKKQKPVSDDKTRASPSARKPESSGKPSVDEILAKIEASGKPASCKRRANKKSETENDSNETELTRRSSRRRPRVKSNSSLENSPQLDVQVVKHNPEKSFTKLDASDSDSDFEFVPKYKPLEPMDFDLNAMLHRPRAVVDHSDEELEQLRMKCERMLAEPSVYANKSSTMLRTNKRQPKASPQMPSRRRRRKCALSSNYNSVNITRSKSAGRTDNSNEQTKSKPRAADEDALVFQVSAAGPETTQTTRVSGLTIIRQKRGAAAEDSQNQPSKRSKPDDEIDRIKFQELAKQQQSIAMPAPAQNKRVARALKTLDGYVVLEKSTRKDDSSDLSAVDSSIVEDKNKTTSKSRATRAKANVSKKEDSSASSRDNSSKENLEAEDFHVESCGTTRPARTIRGRVASRKNATTLVTDASAVKDKKVDSSSISRGNSSSKENLQAEDSDTESQVSTRPTRTIRAPSKRNITNHNVDASTAKGSSKNEILSSSVEDKDTKRTRGKTPNQNQKKTEPLQEDSKSNKKTTIIKDSDSEEAEESEILISKSTRGKKIKESDSSKSDKTSSSIENESLKSSRVRSTRRNQKEEIPEKETDKSQKQTTIIEDSDAEQSQKSDFTNKEPRARRMRNVKSSDSDKSEIAGSENESSRPTRARITRRNQNKNILVKKLDVPEKDTSIIIHDSDSEDSEFVNSTSMRNKDIKNSEPVKPNKSQITNKTKTIENETINASKIRTTRRNQKKEIPDKESTKSKKETSKVQNSELEDSEFDKKYSETSLNKDSNNSDSQKSDVSGKAGTRSRRGKARIESSDSAISETDTDKKKNALSSKNSRSTRQTRKRAATPEVSVADTASSAESQEVAEIFKTVEKEAEKSTTRGRRNAKKESSVTSEDSQDSEDKLNVFERPVSRPKRARITKSAKNKSASQTDPDDDKDSKSMLSQKSTTSRKRKSPSPAPTQTTMLTPSRNRRTISAMSPMKASSYKVLFTGEKDKTHRQIVTKLGGTEVEDPAYCSILVTKKVMRTFKFLCSLARGIPIVSINWLEDSKKAHRFLDWEDYILRDPSAEAQYNFNLKESLEKARNHKLLDGYNVLLTSHLKQPPVSELKEMVISSGGKPLLRAPAKWPENTIVVTKEENLQNAKKLIAKAPKSVTIHSVEFILTGILRQDVNLQEFKLSV